MTTLQPYPSIRPWNALIGWPRLTEKVTWNAGSWRADYPITNSRTLPLGLVARSADLAPASTRMVGLLPAYSRIGLIAVIAHNWSNIAQWRIRIFADAAGAVLVWEKPPGPVWGVAYPKGTLKWTDKNFWTGAFAQEELAGLPWNAPVLIEPSVVGQRIEIDIWDEGNPSGYVQHGLVEVAEALRLPVNFAYGADAGFRARSLRVEAEGGAIYPERRAKGRVFQGSIDLAPEEWAIAQYFEFLRQADVTEPFFWWSRPDSVIETHRSAFLARNADLGLQKLVHHRRRAVALNFNEVL
jgi:hypothetical protein